MPLAGRHPSTRTARRQQLAVNLESMFICVHERGRCEPQGERAAAERAASTRGQHASRLVIASQVTVRPSAQFEYRYSVAAYCESAAVER